MWAWFKVANLAVGKEVVAAGGRDRQVEAENPISSILSPPSAA